jgi:hypothetical protein
MKTNLAQRISIAFFSGLLIFWIVLLLKNTYHTSPSFYFSLGMSILPLVGGLGAMYKSREWKTMESFVGKGIFFLGLGIFCWGVGGLIWAYFNFIEGIPAPYPSVADLFYGPSVFFYAVGVVYLARASGADLGLRRKYAKLAITIVSSTMFVLSYYFLVIVAREGVLVSEGSSVVKSILDVLYPLGDFVSLTVAVLISGLSFRFLTKEYRLAISALLVGLFVMFIADSMFSYTTTQGTYYNANFGDLLFAVGIFLLTFGVLGFCGKPLNQGDVKPDGIEKLWCS